MRLSNCCCLPVGYPQAMGIADSGARSLLLLSTAALRGRPGPCAPAQPCHAAPAPLAPPAHADLTHAVPHPLPPSPTRKPGPLLPIPHCVLHPPSPAPQHTYSPTGHVADREPTWSSGLECAQASESWCRASAGGALGVHSGRAAAPALPPAAAPACRRRDAPKQAPMFNVHVPPAVRITDFMRVSGSDTGQRAHPEPHQQQPQQQQQPVLGGGCVGAMRVGGGKPLASKARAVGPLQGVPRCHTLPGTR